MKRQRVDHAAVIDDLHSQLTERIGEMVSTEQWLAYLQTARAFHRYSPQNQMLLALQGAEGYVASYRNWTRIPSVDGGSCQVAKGQKGLAILAPMISKSVEVDDDTGEETSRKRLRGFRTVRVFHQGQLVAPPDIPEPQMPELLTGENRWQHVWAAVVGQLEDDGYTVSLHTRSPIEKWNGMTTWGERSVKIADDLEPPQRIKTLLHEWAHVQLDHEHRLTAERDTKEIEAESVAYLLAQTIGLDSQSYSIPYVTGWASADVEAVQATAEAVLATTKRLVDVLETDLGVELTPDALDHATPVDADNVATLRPETAAEPPAPSVEAQPSVDEVDQPSLPMEGLQAEVSARRGLDLVEMTDADFVLAVKDRLEPEPARRLMALAYEPDGAGEAAVLMAEAGITAGQTVRVLRHLGIDDARSRAALATPMPHDAERPMLWTTDEIAVAFGDEPSTRIQHRIVSAEERANLDLIVQTYRTAEPARVAALAFGLGVECPDVIRVCVNARPDPTAAFEIAVSMHPGDTDAAIAEVRETWPNPPGGWDAYLPTPAAAAAGADLDDDASTQAILDEWYSLDTVAAPTPAPEHSIT